MTKVRPFSVTLWLAATLAFGLAFTLQAAEMEVYQHVDGTKYFALEVSPEELPSAEAPRNVVVLVNTSAAQTGEYRIRSMDVLKNFLAKLPGDVRVNVLAVDLKAAPMTQGFVAAGSAELEAGLKKLEGRVPLGACDLEAGLKAVVEAVGNTADGASLVYIGDGLSRANLLPLPKIAELADTLASKKISVNSFAIGPRLDLPLLASLAELTGGSVFVDEEVPADALAGQIASATQAGVVWPQSAQWNDAVAEVYPQRLPPLRTDRENIIVGKLSAAGPVELTAVTADGKNIAIKLD
ncbi:MAG: hypothetical protein D6741_19510, partial [Planctomycetota bacterium]